MATLIPHPTVLQAAGSPPKRIEEYIGRLNSATESLSIARMISPPGWSEPGQCPAFEEYTLVLKGELQLRFKDSSLTLSAGQAVIVHQGEWVQYSSPHPEGAEYIAVCLPAFSPALAQRDAE